MSKSNRPRLSLKGEPSAPATAHTALHQAEPNAPTQEKTMEASQENTQEAAAAPSELTAKQMAAAEEENAARAQRLVEQQQQPPTAEPVNILEVASRGYEALQEAFARHNAKKPAEYVPPPRTPRQMQALQEELEAGRRAQARAQEQYDTRPAAKVDGNKEGFTTPVYRPGDVVPDPILPAGAFAAGNRKFGPDAP